MRLFKPLRKRGLALFLVLTMCLSMIQTTAFATENPEPIQTGLIQSAWSDFYAPQDPGLGSNTYNCVSGNIAETGYGKVVLLNEGDTAIDSFVPYFYGNHYTGYPYGYNPNLTSQITYSNSGVATADVTWDSNGRLNVKITKGSEPGATNIYIWYNVTMLHVTSGIACDSDTAYAVSGMLVYTVGDESITHTSISREYWVTYDLNPNATEKISWNGSSEDCRDCDSLFGDDMVNYFGWHTGIYQSYSGGSLCYDDPYSWSYPFYFWGTPYNEKVLYPESVDSIALTNADESIATIRAYTIGNSGSETSASNACGLGFDVTGYKVGTVDVTVKSTCTYPQTQFKGLEPYRDWLYGEGYWKNDFTIDRKTGAEVYHTIHVNVIDTRDDKDITVTYHDGDVTAKDTGKEGSEFTIRDALTSKDGYVFKGWATYNGGSVVYTPGQKQVFNADTDLYAVWEQLKEEVPYKIIREYYDSGTKVATVEIENLKGEASTQIVGKTLADTHENWNTYDSKTYTYKSSTPATLTLTKDAENIITLRYERGVVPTPSLTVTKAVDNSAPKPGESIVYTITVTNTGAGDASDVTVTDVLPTELTFVSWKLNDGEENETQPEDGKYTIGTVDKETGTATLTITAKVGDTVAAGTTIKNIATADYTNKPEGTDPKGEVTVTVAQPKLTGITKELVSVTVNGTVTDMTVEGATLPTVEKGDTVTLRYKITITGSVGAKYEVTDDAVLETGSSLNGELKTGTAEIFVTKGVDTSTVGTKSVTNTAYVKPGEGTDPIQENEPTGHPSNEVNTNIVVTDPDANKYSVIYSWGKIGVTPVSYVLPEGTKLPDTAKYVADATVPVDTSITKDVKAMVGEDTYIFNGWKTTDAEVKNGGFTMPAKDVALSADWVKVSYSIGVTKKITAVTHEGVTTQINEGDPVRVDHDDTVTYEVTVTNTSNQTLYALRLDDVMDPGLTLITGTDHADVEKNGDNTSTIKYLGTTVVKDPAELDVEGQTPYYWELPGSFAVGAKVTLTYQAKINMDAEHIIKNANENVQLNNTIYASAFQTPQPESEPEPADTLAVEELSYSIVSFRGDVSGSASAGAGSAGASASGTMSYPVTYSWGKVGDTEVTETTAGLPATVRHHKGDVVDVDTTAKTATTTIGEDENQKTYKFGGWTTSDATVTDGKFSMPGQKVVLTARWVEVIVTFDPNGGSWAEDETPKRVEADADGKVTAPAAPTNGDKEFEGWFTEGGEKVDPATKIFTEDTTLYAHWKVKEDKPTTYTVTVYYVYSTGGPASDPVTKTLEKGEEYSIPSPSITGYKPSEGTVSGIMEDKDVVRTVVYTPEDTSRPTHTVTVHYVYEGGTRALPDAIVTVEEGKDYSIPSPAINGYNVDRPVVSGTMRDVNVEVTVTYSRINIPTPPTPTYFTVTWLDELAPGETVKTQRVTSLREAVYPAHPFHPGYEGNGWSEPVRDASGNYTITAQYVQLRVDPQVPSYEYLRDVLKVTVEVVCDTHATHEPMVYNVPLKEDSYGGAVIGDRCVITIAPEAYVAEYIGDHSTVDVAPQTIELVYVASAAEPVALFEKASEPASEEIPAVEVEIPEEEETVISEESPVPVEDSVGDAAETGTEETTDEETIELSVTSEATIEGHWEIADGSAALVIFHVRCEVPEPETYTVTWLDDNGALLDRQTAEIGQPEPTYAGVAPSKPGYTFAGWSDPEVDDDGNIIYVAQYEPVAPAETYMVTWLDDNGALLDRQTVEIGQPEPAYGGTAPSKPGYTFTGWSDPEVDDDGNIIYVAQYEPVAPAGTYTVTWLDDNGTLLDRQTVENGQPEPAYGGTAPSKSGYTFTGWSEPVTDGAGNVTYVAQYEPVPETPSETHTVTWVDWNGTRLQQAVVNNGAAEPSYTGTTPVRSSDGVYYYTFAGWSAPAVDADGNVTYTAQYTPTLVYNPGTPSYPSYPSNPSTPGNPSTPSNPTPPTTDIPDTNPPLTDNPSGDGTTITDQDVPLAGAVGLNDVDHFAYIIGYSDDTVRPLNNITRAEVATIFFRLMTDEYRTSNWATTNDFSDVAAGNWFNNAISTCANAGALNGYSNGSFRPNANITRAEFAAIAARFLDKEQYTDDGTGDFSDTADHWAAKEIRLAAKAGWIQGSGNKFRPNDYITRAEVMTIVNRMLDRVPDKDHMLDTMKKWTDNPEDAWYYEAVQEATNEHAYERDELGVVETWTEILTVRDWKALEAEWASANAR